MKKLIRYRLGISVKFPATHPSKGQNTWFEEKITKIIRYTDQLYPPKIHTIRKNYPLWQKRFEKINRGEAVLELYYWSGKPYNSKCVTICQLSKDDGIGVQELQFDDEIFEWSDSASLCEFLNDMWNYKDISFIQLAHNDGLSLEDFKAWFKGYDLSEPMAIIHFTKFRY